MDLSTPQNLLIFSIYIVLAGILSFFSIFGIYILLRYGRSTSLGLAVSLFYGFIFFQILTQSYFTLRALLS